MKLSRSPNGSFLKVKKVKKESRRVTLNKFQRHYKSMCLCSKNNESIHVASGYADELEAKTQSLEPVPKVAARGVSLNKV